MKLMKQKLILVALVIGVLISGCVEEQEKGKVERVDNENQTKSTGLHEQNVSQEDQEKENKSSEAKILQIADTHTEVKKFIQQNPDYEHIITQLTAENTTKLAEEYPVIYGTLPSRTLYRVNYKSNNKGLLVIVDFEEKRVLKYFKTTGINL